MIPILRNDFQIKEAEETLSKSLYETRLTLIPKPDKNIIIKKNYRQVFLRSTDVKFTRKTLANYI